MRSEVPDRSVSLEDLIKLLRGYELSTSAGTTFTLEYNDDDDDEEERRRRQR